MMDLQRQRCEREDEKEVRVWWKAEK
jgi:hypothetical protein